MDEFGLVPKSIKVSNNMKARFIGEFTFEEPDAVCDEDGVVEELMATRTVPWDLCKRIFKEMTAAWIEEISTPPQPGQIEVSIEGIGMCSIMVVDGKAIMPAVTVQDIVSKACLVRVQQPPHVPADNLHSLLEAVLTTLDKQAAPFPVMLAVDKVGKQFIQSLSRPTDPVIDAILWELEKATSKFPTWPTDPLHASGVVMEEAGELAKAVLQAVYEPHKSTPEDVKTEAVQTAAMAIRFLRSMHLYVWAQGAQHKQGGG